jgi:streptomycin 6-kinase
MNFKVRHYANRLSAMSSQPFKHWLVRWQLTPDGAEFTTRFGSRLIPVLWRGERAILKLAGNEEERRGAKLMEWYGGTGAARVLAREGDALLLERLTGERSLSDMARCGQDDDATRILCRTAWRFMPRATRQHPLSLSRWRFGSAPWKRQRLSTAGPSPHAPVPRDLYSQTSGSPWFFTVTSTMTICSMVGRAAGS